MTSQRCGADNALYEGADGKRRKESSVNPKERKQCSGGDAGYPRENSDSLEPLNADTFSRRLNSLSEAVNVMDEFREAFVRQHPQYGKRLSDIP